MKTKAIQFLVMLLLLVIPAISMAQTGLEEPNPSGREGVTFDEKMNLFFIIVGIAIAIMITIKQLHKKTAASK